MKRIFRLETKRNENGILTFFSLLLYLLPIYGAQNTLECTELIQNNKCTCYIFENAVYLDCQDTSIKDVKNALKSMTNVHSLSIYDLDESDDVLGPHFIPQGACIKHIHISRTNIRAIDDETFTPLRKCLETLSIVSSKIKFIPQKALSGMLKLLSLELISNYIEEIPSYNFYGLPLIKLNIKGNIVRRISDTAFTSLELSLSEVDLSENNLTSFPIVSIASLKNLRSLKLAWNEIFSIENTENTNLECLEYLDLNSNNFEFISEDCLKFSPSLKELSFHFNFIANVHHRAFYSLVNLKSLDLSHNRIKILHSNIFQNNKNLELIDLSHNHLHHIHGLLCNMPILSKIFLSHNNVLEVPIDSFFNSTKISVIQLDKNCIHNINSESFSDLESLEELQLDFNYLNEVPHSILLNNRNLTKLRLDNNNFSDINNSTLATLKNLKELRLNNNWLKLISKQMFINSFGLEEIYLNHNKISFIETGTFKKMLNLKYISLHNNNLVEINDILPNVNSKILLFYLDFNQLTSINNIVLGSQKRLHQLSLKNNRLKFIARNTFSNLTYLTRLELSNNELLIIDDFSFQRLNSARYLNLQHNMIKNITSYTFFGLSELEDLDLSHNKIVYIFDMAFDTLKKLRILNISFNPLRILHKNIFQHGLPLSSLLLDTCEIEFVENGTFQGLNNLKHLSLKNNLLKSNDLLCLEIPGLKHLTLSYNILDYLPMQAFSNLPLLEILFLEHCNIEKIIEGTFINNKNLEKLNLAQNIIGNIPEKLFSAFNSISELNVSNNFLDYVPYNVFDNFTSIESLDIADNLIPKLEISGFEKLVKLKSLILRKNEIELITSSKKITLNELTLFDVSYNRLDHLPKQLFENFPNIQNINISHNNIIRFDFLMSKTLGVSLINMDLSKNPAVSWTTTNNTENNTLLANLYELHICFTNLTIIEDVTFELFISLQHLYLNFNKIRRLSISPFSKLIFLENLDLSVNRITHLKTSNFRGLIKLNSLCISNNNVESMESFDEDLSNLKLLDLSYNKLQNIINEHFIHLKELTVLNLAYNNIKYLSATSFNNLNKIIEIDLEHNKLQTIPMELLTSIENHVQEISIKDNVIICRCQKNNTWTWIQDHPKIIKPYSVICFNDDYPREKCDFPLIVHLSIDKHNDNSVLVTWLIRNRTALKALKILYYNENVESNVKLKVVEKNTMSTLITELQTNMHYIVCLLTMYEDSVINFEEDNFMFTNYTDSGNNVTSNMDRNIVNTLIAQSPASECVSFDTMKKPLTVKIKTNKGFKMSSILNRRTGLIVGCCLGFIVFFIMVTVLLYTKVKERKRIAKSDPAWSEMNDYHSMQSKEDIQESTTASTDNILLGMAKNRTISFDKIK
ncbi:protein artichoke [Bicyclus anynana]|uniref:Protein artichoke n=1 Tax=Bicyclus anynana TaxID=110368 RepID=A0A6J1MHJ8_BICAN|nr:protein artichoke [Bicyclus anynana]